MVNHTRSARASLLKSAWFSDAGETSVSPLSALLATVTLSDGKLLLPPLSSSTRVPDLKVFVQGLAKKVGTVGKAAVADYLRESRFPQDHEIWPVLEAAFVVAPTRKRKA